MYNQVVMDHFKNPRNVGEMDNPDGVGEVGNPLCGDMMHIYVKVQDDKIDDIKFQTFGCGSAIAVSSMLTEMAKGKTLEEAKQLSNQDIADALEGLPQNKMHCSNLGADALHQAIQDFEHRRDGVTPKEQEPQRKETHEHAEGEKCYCPYCDVEIKEEVPTFCHACQSDLGEDH
jgi:nitrogen fixation NifU-like protein